MPIAQHAGLLAAWAEGLWQPVKTLKQQMQCQQLEVVRVRGWVVWSSTQDRPGTPSTFVGE